MLLSWILQKCPFHMRKFHPRQSTHTEWVVVFLFSTLSRHCRHHPLTWNVIKWEDCLVLLVVSRLFEQQPALKWVNWILQRGTQYTKESLMRIWVSSFSSSSLSFFHLSHHHRVSICIFLLLLSLIGSINSQTGYEKLKDEKERKKLGCVSNRQLTVIGIFHWVIIPSRNENHKIEAQS